MPDKMQPDKMQNDPKEPKKQDTSVKVPHAQPGGQTDTATGAEPEACGEGTERRGSRCAMVGSEGLEPPTSCL